MAHFDRWLAFYIAGAAFGIVLMVLGFLGEFVFGWWHDGGVWVEIAGFAITVVFGFFASTKFQVRELGTEIRIVARGVDRVQASTRRLEASSGRLEESSRRIETNTEALPRMEELLREIRDRLPQP